MIKNELGKHDLLLAETSAISSEILASSAVVAHARSLPHNKLFVAMAGYPGSGKSAVFQGMCRIVQGRFPEGCVLVNPEEESPVLGNLSREQLSARYEKYKAELASFLQAPESFCWMVNKNLWFTKSGAEFARTLHVMKDLEGVRKVKVFVPLICDDPSRRVPGTPYSIETVLMILARLFNREKSGKGNFRAESDPETDLHGWMREILCIFLQHACAFDYEKIKERYEADPKFILHEQYIESMPFSVSCVLSQISKPARLHFINAFKKGFDAFHQEESKRYASTTKISFQVRKESGATARSKKQTVPAAMSEAVDEMMAVLFENQAVLAQAVQADEALPEADRFLSPEQV